MDKGASIKLKLDGSILALGREHSIEADCTMLETASAASGDAKEYLPGRYSWKIQAKHLVGNFTENLLNYLKRTSTPLSVELAGDSGFYGSCYIKQFKIGAPVFGFSTCDITLIGSGTLAQSTQNIIIDTTEIVFPWEGGTKKINIKSNTNWTIS